MGPLRHSVTVDDEVIALRRFEKITSIIPALEDEGKHGEWIVDAEHRGASDDPVQMPFVGYGRAGEMLIEAVHECVEDLSEVMDVHDYMGVLESYGLHGVDDIQAVDASACDAKCTLAMILAIVRQDRFCEGLLLHYLESGKMLEWMKRLAELDEQ